MLPGAGEGGHKQPRCSDRSGQRTRLNSLNGCSLQWLWSGEAIRCSVATSHHFLKSGEIYVICPYLNVDKKYKQFEATEWADVITSEGQFPVFSDKGS